MSITIILHCVIPVNYRIIDLSIIAARVELFTETWYIHYAELIQT